MQSTIDRSEKETVRVPTPDQVIAEKYRIIERIGAGGMGLVFLAEPVGGGAKVAVKFLDPEPSADSTRNERFIQEARLAMQVTHPGAAQLPDAGAEPERGYLYLVFEYVPGKDLRELLAAEWKLTFEEARAIILGAAEPLSFAHAKGIVHRDVKPENIRVQRSPEGVKVKLLDFGIARLAGQSGVRLTSEGMLAGTPRYMAPEQVRDGALDGRTDGYALGLVLFECLSGQPAYGGTNPTKVMMRQVEEPMPSLSALLPGLNDTQLDTFFSVACAKAPDARFPTMEAFAEALRKITIPVWPNRGPRPVIVPTFKPQPLTRTYKPPPPADQRRTAPDAPKPPVKQTLFGAPFPLKSRRSAPGKAFILMVLAALLLAGVTAGWLHFRP